jgi:Mn2+/Fe2+ NRAMP family transporter
MNILATLIYLFVGISTILWIDRLEKEKCVCSEDLRRSQIKNWWTFMIIFVVISFIISLIIKEDNQAVQFLTLGVSLVGFVFVVISLIYIVNLRKKKCECSDSIGRDILFAYDILILLLVGLLVLTFILGVLSALVLSTDKKIKK